MLMGGFSAARMISPTPAAHYGADGHGRLDAVQVLRALAALGVLTAHTLHELRQIGAAAGVAYDQRAFFPWDAGVDAPTFRSGWPLNYGMYFYAVFALSLSLRARAGLALLAAYFLGSVALGLALPATAPFPLAYWTRPIVLEFLLGVLVGHAHLA